MQQQVHKVHLHRPYVGQAFACFEGSFAFLRIRITERRAYVNCAEYPVVVFVRVGGHVYAWVQWHMGSTYELERDMVSDFLTCNVPTRSICIRSLNVVA